MEDAADPTLDLPASLAAGEWSSESSDAEDSRETKSHDSNALEGVEAIAMKLELSSAVDEINQSAKARFLQMQQTQVSHSQSFEASDGLESSHQQMDTESFKHSLEGMKQREEDNSVTSSSSGLSAELANQSSFEKSKQIAVDTTSSSSGLSEEVPNDSSLPVATSASPTNAAPAVSQSELQLSLSGVDTSEPTFNSLFDSHASVEAKSRAKSAVLDTSRDVKTALEGTQAMETTLPVAANDSNEMNPAGPLSNIGHSKTSDHHDDSSEGLEPHSVDLKNSDIVDTHGNIPSNEQGGTDVWNESVAEVVGRNEDCRNNDGRVDDDEDDENDDDLERSRPSARGLTSSTRESDEAAREWAFLNRSLGEAGLPEIELRPSDPSNNGSNNNGNDGSSSGWAHAVQVGGISWLVEPGSVRKALAETLKQYTRRGQRLRELHGRPGGAAGLASPMPSAAPASSHLSSAPTPKSTSLSRGHHSSKSSHRSGGSGGNMSQSHLRNSVDSNNDDDEMERVAHQEARLQRTVQRLEEQLSEADAEATKLRRAMAEEARQHAAREKELKLQVKQSEHRVKVQEALQEKLADKLRVQVDLERATRERDRKAFLKVARRPPQLQRGSDARLMELVSAYETQRQASEQEVAELHKEVHRLHEDLREKENTILRHGYGLPGIGPKGKQQGGGLVGPGVSFGGMSSFSEGPSNASSSGVDASHLGGEAHSVGVGGDESPAAVAALADKYREQGRALHVAQARQEELTAAAAQSSQAAQRATAEMEAIAEECENLKMELASRPSLKQWHGAKAEVAALRDKLIASDRRLQDASDLKVLKQHASTRSLIEKDRENHRLGLAALADLPNEYAKEMLAAACRQLKVSDVGLIAPSIGKMQAALALLPRLEKFARSVCDLVLAPLVDDNENSGQHQTAGSAQPRRAMEDALPVLAAWRNTATEVQQLTSLRSAVVNSLAKRSHLPRKQNRQLQSNSKGGEGGDVERGEGGQEFSDEEVVAGVADLVALESQLLARTQSYEAAEHALALDPDLLNNRIVLHFQYLFQVRKLEGVFPKMNELYVFCSEVQSVLRALRSVCRLPVNASPKAVLGAVQHLLVTSAADAKPGGEGRGKGNGKGGAGLGMSALPPPPPRLPP